MKVSRKNRYDIDIELNRKEFNRTQYINIRIDGLSMAIISVNDFKDSKDQIHVLAHCGRKMDVCVSLADGVNMVKDDEFENSWRNIKTKE